LNSQFQKFFNFRFLFLLLPFAYYLLYAHYGLDDIDGGYVTALAWRVYSGEIPYKDFIVVRPPLFIYLHSWTMYLLPANMVIISERFLVYISFAIFSFISAEIIQRNFDLAKYQIDRWLLACIFFVFSVHNFPPMPWHTTDGILLGTVGIYLLTCTEGMAGLAVGMLFLLASALCKQSFYPMPLIGLGFILLNRGWKKFFIQGFIFAAVLALLIFFANRSGLLAPFLFWTNGSTKLSDLLMAGVWNYLKTNPRIYLSIIISFFIIQFAVNRILKKKIETGWIVPYYFLVIFALIIYKSFSAERVHFQPNYPQVIFMAVVIMLLLENKFRKPGKEILILFFMLALAWCASISWGYMTPLLYAPPLLFGIFRLAMVHLNFSKPKFLYRFILFGGLFAYFFSYQAPYSDSRRSALTYDMGTVFPKLCCIKSDKETFDKYSELKGLAIIYHNNFKTLPSMPLSNYLCDSQSPLGLDWVMDIEVNRHEELLMKELESKQSAIFLEKNPVFKINSWKWGSKLSVQISQQWKLAAETNYFRVYLPPEKSNN